MKNPRVELQDGTVTGDYDAREVFGDEGHLVAARRGGLAGLCQLPDQDGPPDSGVRADPGARGRLAIGIGRRGTIDRCPPN